MNAAERVRDLVTQAKADWHQPPPPQLLRADPTLVRDELRRRRRNAREWYLRETAMWDDLEARIDTARQATP